MSHFPLNSAALCEDCRQVGDSLSQCACCGSRSLLALAPVLNRDTVDEYALEKVLWAIESADTKSIR